MGRPVEGNRTTWPVEWRDLARWATKVERVEIVYAGQCATAGEEDVCSTAIGAKLSARIGDPFSGEADYCCAATPQYGRQPPRLAHDREPPSKVRSASR
jgi:hypothetical protein